MVLGAMRPAGLVPPDGFEFFPRFASWTNFSLVFHFVPMGLYLRNSLFVVAIAVPITVLVASWAGFAIATASPRRQKALIVMTLAAQMVPLSALWIPRFAIFKWAGILDTPLPLIAPALIATAPFYVLIFALAYSRIPKDLFAAAELDGWSPFSVWRRVAFPLAEPAAFAVAVLAFVAHWSNFVDPLLYLNDPDRYTVPLGLRALQTLEPANYPILLAAAVIATGPPVIAFFLVQRAFFRKTLEL
jgi:multiple sugar transport system permease protein